MDLQLFDLLVPLFLYVIYVFDKLKKSTANIFPLSIITHQNDHLLG